MGNMDVQLTYQQNGHIVARTLLLSITTKLLEKDFNGAWLALIAKLLHHAALQNYATQQLSMMEYVMISITERYAALMVEIVVTTKQDGTQDARKTMVIVHAKKNAKMETLVPAPTFVVFKLLQVVVIIMAVHLMEYKPLVDQFAKGYVTNVMLQPVKMLEPLWETMETISVLI